MKPNDWPFDEAAGLEPSACLRRVGEIFAVFDRGTQDSGNVSFGVEANGRRWFVKTAGDPKDDASFLDHPRRVALLLNRRELARSVAHPALPALRGVAASAWGPMLIHDWASGELLHAPAEWRGDPQSAFQRFRRLPAPDLAAAIDTILDAHVAICGAGWVACDFYDGSILHDFAARRTWLIDLDNYRRGAFGNDMGRMFGSSRFMAPEEFERGAAIDERTTVFTLGRAICVLMGDGGLGRSAFRGTDAQHRAMARACQSDPAARFASVAELARAWSGASDG